MRPRLSTVLVRGPSMAPALRDEDIVLVRWGVKPKPGQVVLVSWASRPGQLSVKRASHEVDGGWHVVGDNPYASTDSEHLGPAQVLGVVKARLWPRPGFRL
ncbi:S26 family signal peptidase [Lentzea sp. NBC_00516]|uniref:S24 family peptidase n=1 Tax=Lentzea sp. NBC_00516 TaxID=2903582 RepID=UPI002E811783|nr:S24 family peptidase [Lentzea sp. NBC_00516]WUD23781.1 S26 family signal peptidase [Lentzea sp. NBC_00516]